MGDVPDIMELYQRWLQSPGVTPEVICKDHPHLLPDLLACIARAAALTDPLPQSDSEPDDPDQTLTENTDETVTQQKSPPAPSSAAPPDPVAPRGYAIDLSKQRVGEGGLGEIFEAYDQTLGRTVALKRIHRKVLPSPRTLHRFITESRVTAQLEHPGIVPVHAAGNENGPYYTMKLIKGKTLRVAIREHFKNAHGPSRELLRRFIAVCQAVEFAHSRKIIHRDIKPGNIMLGEYGETILLDWGLAKELGSREEAGAVQTERSAPEAGEPEATRDGETMGTPNYMPPEQKKGLVSQHSEASDIYALGGVLHMILTSVSPEGQRPLSVSQVPKALMAVVKKAREEKPENRFASAAEMAREVQRWLDDEPLSVHKDPLSLRLLRWMRRHQTFVTVAAAILLLGIAGILINNTLVRREQQNTAREERQRREELARSTILTADALAAGGRPLESLEKIESARAIYAGLGKQQQDVMLAALNAVWRQGHPSLSALDVENWFRDAAICPGRGEALAVGSDGRLHRIQLMDPKDNPLAIDAATLTAVAVAPGGEAAAVGSNDGKVQLLQAADGKPLWPAAAEAHAQAVRSIRFSPGSMIASLGGDSSVWLWTREAGSGKAVQLPGNGRARAICFAGQDKLLVAQSTGIVILTGDPAQPATAWQATLENPTAIAASRDGSVIIAGDDKGFIHLWKQGQPAGVVSLRAGPIHRLSASPDGHRLWYATQEGRCGILNLETGEVDLSFSPAARSPVQCLDADWESGLGITAARVNSTWKIESWNLRGNALEVNLANSRDLKSTAAFSQAGTLMIGIHGNGQTAAWDLKTGFELAARGMAPKGSLFAAGGSACYVAADDFKAAKAEGKLYSVEDGNLLATVPEVAAAEFRALSDDATLIATVVEKDSAQWKIGIHRDGRQEQTVKCASRPVAGAFSPDKASLAIGLENGEVLLVACRDGSTSTIGPQTSPVRTLCFMGNKELIVAHRDGMLRLWSPGNPSRNRAQAEHQRDIKNVIFSEKAGLVFSAGWDGKLCIWTRGLDLVRTIDMPASLALLAASPAGDCLIFSGDEGFKALHLDFAQRIVDANTGRAAAGADRLAQRYFALGRYDWALEIPAKDPAWLSQADRARLLWLLGRHEEAEKAFSNALVPSPPDAPDLQECLTAVRHARSSAMPPATTKP
jgi:serine/threonine protein kinase/WD40 repeat protein